MLSNPEALRNMINSNPFLKQMVDNNPEMAAALNDPAMMQMMADPQVINAALGMMNRMGNNPLGSMMGGTGSFPSPGKNSRFLKKYLLYNRRRQHPNTKSNLWNDWHYRKHRYDWKCRNRWFWWLRWHGRYGCQPIRNGWFV